MTAHATECFRPTLETLENRELMDAGIGGAVMHPMMPEFTNLTKLITAGSYVGGLGFATGAIMKFKQHKDNPTAVLSQALTQANQAFLAQSQPLNANAVVHIFSAASPTGLMASAAPQQQDHQIVRYEYIHQHTHFQPYELPLPPRP
jgi:hypothetical protein